MMYEPLEKMFFFIVDTEQYSGNFEREMVAYMTGLVGECGVGSTYEEIYRKEMGISPDDYDHNNHIVNVPDDHGCFRPATMWTTPGWFNNGLGDAFREGTDEEIVRESRRIYLKNELARRGNDDPWVNDELAKLDGPVTHYPSYQSVAIPMSRPPSDDEAQILMERAIKFAQLTKKRIPEITITGFRILMRQIILSPWLEWDKNMVPKKA